MELHKGESVDKSSEHQRSLEQLRLEHRRQVEELEEVKNMELRQKHELALSLRGVEALFRTCAVGI